jgi:hypothetical protein
MALSDKVRKATKAEANYRRPAPARDRRCAVCTMFRPPESCTAVEGRISREATCKYFEAKR